MASARVTTAAIVDAGVRAKRRIVCRMGPLL